MLFYREGRTWVSRECEKGREGKCCGYSVPALTERRHRVTRLDYDNLQKIARETRAELTVSGEIDLGRPRIRKKPRDAEKLALLYRMALNRIEKYPPRRDEKGRLVLPYFGYADGV